MSSKVNMSQIEHKVHDLAILKLSKLVSGTMDSETIYELYEKYYAQYVKEFSELSKKD